MQPVRYRPLLLLVDGDPVSRGELAAYLCADGFDVTPAANGEQAVAAMGRERVPDLVMLDPATPCVNATGLCARLRETAPSRFLPVLGLTRTTQEGERLAVHDDLLTDFLVRPLNPEWVASRARTLLKQRSVCEGLAHELERQAELGIALSAEHNLKRLLERMVDEARALNGADAGTLYTVDPDAGVLRFEILQNETLGTRLGGSEGSPISLPPVPISHEHVSGHVALTGEPVNIADVYETSGFDFSGPRRYDAMTGYRSRSMLAVPIHDRDMAVIGILQLINAHDPKTGNVVPFSPRNIERTRALASQAGVALTNARLIGELHSLFDGLIEVMASIVDEKSPSTAGHVRRVTGLALRLAQAWNDHDRSQALSPSQLEELRVAGMLHDIGKIAVPEFLTEKATKLQRVHDRITEIRTRFTAIRRGMEIDALRLKLAAQASGAAAGELLAIEQQVAEQSAQLELDLRFIEAVNLGGEALSAASRERLERIGSRTWVDDNGRTRPYLTRDELANLSIQRGTLLPEELERVRAHAAVTHRLVSRIPFGRGLRGVAQIAGDHHEALDGSGYPLAKRGEEISLAARILAVADIYDALTAADRPYKAAYTPEHAAEILRREAERGKLDPRLVDLFIQSRCAEAR